MHWAEYRTNSKKAKLHLGFDLNHGVPNKLFLTEGRGAEKPFVSKIINPGQTGVMNRGYQAHNLFDQWKLNGCRFVCRVKENTRKTVLEEFPMKENSYVFFDAKVLLVASTLIKPKSLCVLSATLLAASSTGLPQIGLISLLSR